VIPMVSSCVSWNAALHTSKISGLVVLATTLRHSSSHLKSFRSASAILAYHSPLHHVRASTLEPITHNLMGHTELVATNAYTRVTINQAHQADISRYPRHG
jgi:hypothetical protein